METKINNVSTKLKTGRNKRKNFAARANTLELSIARATGSLCWSLLQWSVAKKKVRNNNSLDCVVVVSSSNSLEKKKKFVEFEVDGRVQDQEIEEFAKQMSQKSATYRRAVRVCACATSPLFRQSATAGPRQCWCYNHLPNVCTSLSACVLS